MDYNPRGYLEWLSQFFHMPDKMSYLQDLYGWDRDKQQPGQVYGEGYQRNPVYYNQTIPNHGVGPQNYYTSDRMPNYDHPEYFPFGMTYDDMPQYQETEKERQERLKNSKYQM